MARLGKKTLIGLGATAGLVVLAGAVYKSVGIFQNGRENSEPNAELAGVEGGQGSITALSACKYLDQEGNLQLVVIGKLADTGDFCLGTLPANSEGTQFVYWERWNPEIGDFEVIKVDSTNRLGPERQ